MDLPNAQIVRRAGDWSGAYDLVVLSYEERFLRRKVLETVHDERFLVDLAKTTSVDQRDAFELADGRLIEVIAAEEYLLEITSDNLARIAWHIGNRHAPAQIEAGRILIQRDHVMAEMLAKLGATVREMSEPFMPEGGAYGHGRTHGHDHSHGHGPESHGHDH